MSLPSKDSELTRQRLLDQINHAVALLADINADVVFEGDAEVALKSYPPVLQDMAASFASGLTDTLAQLGARALTPEELAGRALQFVNTMRAVWGGAETYVPGGHEVEVKKAHDQILRLHNGGMAISLIHKRVGLSDRQVRRVINDDREHRQQEAQTNMFDDA